jgi:endonuclease/exonuclease/phosphatase family metal-dependent hydrolase
MPDEPPRPERRQPFLPPVSVEVPVTATPARVRAALAALVVLPLTGVAAAPPAGADTPSMTIGTYNIRAGVSVDAFQSALDSFLPKVQVAGLQEVNSKDKQQVLEGLQGWSFFRPQRLHGEQNPVLWDTSVFKLLSHRSARLDAAFTCHEIPGTSDYNPNYAVVVRLQQRATGAKISVVDIHLVNGAILNGEPRPGRAVIFQHYLRQVANLATLVKSERTWGPTYVLGDFNVGWVADSKHRHAGLPYRTFKAIGMKSMWATERPVSGGTHSVSLIDQVYATAAASSAKVAFDVSGSDHYPAVSTYPVP